MANLHFNLTTYYNINMILQESERVQPERQPPRLRQRRDLPFLWIPCKIVNEATIYRDI